MYIQNKRKHDYFKLCLNFDFIFFKKKLPFSIILIHKNSWKIFELDRSLCKYSNTFVISIFSRTLRKDNSFLFVVYPRKWINVFHSRYFRGRYTLSLSWKRLFSSCLFLFSLFFFIYIPTGDEGRRLGRKWDTRNRVHEGLIPFRKKYGLINIELILKKKKKKWGRILPLCKIFNLMYVDDFSSSCECERNCCCIVILIQCLLSEKM